MAFVQENETFTRAYVFKMVCACTCTFPCFGGPRGTKGTFVESKTSTKKTKNIFSSFEAVASKIKDLPITVIIR